jgi:transitional endoplasmic reticulum ATPase
MDGVEELEGVLVVAATNRKDMLDPALLRPGRFDLVLEVPPPDAGGRAKIFAVHLHGKPVAADVDAADLATRTEGMTGAEIELVCRRAALLAVRGFLASQGEARDPSRLEIPKARFLTAIDEVTRGARTGG